MTPAQLKLLGMARREAQKKTRLDEAGYRLILRNVAHCDSGSDIATPEQFERIMALLEARGYRHPKGERHFRDKVGRRNDGEVTEQQLHKIDAMSAKVKYPLPGLVHRVSKHRTDQVTALTDQEAYNLIEALKQIVARASRPCSSPVPRASRPCSPIRVPS